MYKTNWVMGMWAVKDQITLSTLVGIGKELAESDSAYAQVIVRKTSKDTFSICFIYELPKGAECEVAQAEYIHRTSTWLHARLGSNLIGHDIASPAYVAKIKKSQLPKRSLSISRRRG